VTAVIRQAARFPTDNIDHIEILHRRVEIAKRIKAIDMAGETVGQSGVVGLIGLWAGAKGELPASGRPGQTTANPLLELGFLVARRSEGQRFAIGRPLGRVVALLAKGQLAYRTAGNVQ
jgi:hypothetical protein